MNEEYSMSEQEQIYRKSTLDLHKLVEHKAKLNAVEEKFRKYYQRHTEEKLEMPHSQEEVSGHIKGALMNSEPELLGRLLEDSLEENAFFDFNMDSVIFQHLRYLPAYWHSHDFFEIMCVFWGTCTNYIEGRTLTMNPGDICILRPHTRHAVSAFSDDCIIFNIELRKSTFEDAFFSTMEDEDILAAFFHHSLYNSNGFPYLLFHTHGDFELYDHLLFAVDEFENDRLLKRRMLNNIIMAFFIILLRRHGHTVVIPQLEMREADENAVYMLLYMQKNFATVSLHELATFFNYSDRQVQRLIKSLTGKSYLENIQNLKMQHAAAMLKSSKRSITQIAHDLGFSDMANFRTIFRRYYHMNPVEYRQLQTEKTSP